MAAQAAAEAAYDSCRAQIQKILTLSHRVANERVQLNLARPHCVETGKAARPTDAWVEAWITSGLATAKPCLRQLILPPRNAPANAAQQPAQQTPKATPPPDPVPPDTLVIYTDGSGPDRGSTNQAAGWGYVVVNGGDGEADDHATELHSRHGGVVTNNQHAQHVGAERATNNTAELSAIAHALEYVTADHSGRPVLIRFDSLYAGNMAIGKWRVRKNQALVMRVRALWAKAHNHLHGRLWATHVYGHTGHKWNDRADELARQGKAQGGAP